MKRRTFLRSIAGLAASVCGLGAVKPPAPTVITPSSVMRRFPVVTVSSATLSNVEDAIVQQYSTLYMEHLDRQILSSKPLEMDFT